MRFHQAWGLPSTACVSRGSYPGALAKRTARDEEADSDDGGSPLLPNKSKSFISDRLDRKRSHSILASVIFLFVVIIFSSAPSPTLSETSELQKRAELDRPYISYLVNTVGFAQQREKLRDLEPIAKAAIEEKLAKSMTAYLAEYSDNREADYNIRININVRDDGIAVADFILVDADGRTVYQKRRELPEDTKAASSVIEDELVVLTAPPGIIARHQVSLLAGRPGSGFECFLMVEVDRAGGASSLDLLRSCLADFPDSEYAPFLHARQLFWKFQSEAMKSDKFDESSSQWTELGILLEKYPANPYLNALAAKVLLGDGECAPAQRYIDTTFAQGNIYPALELMLATELSGCALDEKTGSFWEHRTVEIVSTNGQPHPLLELYELIALLAYDQGNLIESLPAKPFNTSPSNAIERIASRIKYSALSGTPFGSQEELRAVIWNEHVRARVSNGLTAVAQANRRGQKLHSIGQTKNRKIRQSI